MPRSFDPDDWIDSLVRTLSFNAQNPRAAVVMRIVLGLLVMGLCLAAALHFAFGSYTENHAFRLFATVFFLMGAAAGCFNVMAGRRLHWPWKGLVMSFILAALARVLMGP